MQIRNALVTGAGARLGRTMALALADEGFNVAVHYFGSSDDAEAACQQLAVAASDCDGGFGALLSPYEPDVIDGASDLFYELFGPVKGQHARTAVGMFELPHGIPVEINGEFVLKPKSV